MRTESEFTRAFCKDLEKVNCKVIAIVASEMQEAGIPDRYVMHKFFPQGQVWLEFKRDKGKLRAKQQDWFEKAEEHEVDALVVRWIRPTGCSLENWHGRELVVFDYSTLKKPKGWHLRQHIIEALNK